MTMKKACIAMILLVLLTFFLTGCQQAPVADTASLEDYLATVKEQSEAIKTALAQENLTQTDMNQKSEELRALWESALNHLLDEAKRTLPEDTLAQLTAGQTAWQAAMTAAVDEAGKAYEGGSIYPLVVNSEAARLTEERVYELCEQLK